MVPFRFAAAHLIGAVFDLEMAYFKWSASPLRNVIHVARLNPASDNVPYSDIVTALCQLASSEKTATADSDVLSLVLNSLLKTIQWL